jgi:hypothetical protein
VWSKNGPSQPAVLGDGLDVLLFVRRLSQQVQLSTSTCHNILKKDIHLYPYRLQAVQQLLEADYLVRVEYCHWFLNTMNENSLNWSFFSDESWFYLDGYVNSQNMRWWSSEKPNFFEEVPLHPQKVGVWAAISRPLIIGPFFFAVQICTIKMFFSKKLMIGTNFFRNLGGCKVSGNHTAIS